MPDPVQNTSLSSHPAAAPGTASRPVLPPVNSAQNHPVSVHAEQEPIGIKNPSVSPEAVDHELVEVSHPEVKVSQELKNIVEKSPDTEVPKIEKDVQLAGVTPAKQTTPVISTSFGSIKLPMTYSQARQSINDTRLEDSMHWLSALVIYQWCKYDPDAVRENK